MQPRAAPGVSGAANHLVAVRHAQSQAGVISSSQLKAVGFTPAMVRSQVAANRLQPLLRGVFATFTGELSPQARWWAAHLYAGEGAILIGRSALQAWGAQEPEKLVLLGVPPRRVVMPQQDIEIRRVVATASRNNPKGAPPTQSIEGAVLDVAAALTSTPAAELVSRVMQQRRSSVAKVRRELWSRQRYRHRNLIEELLTEHETGLTTPLEVAGTKKVLKPHGLPVGIAQVRQYRDGRAEDRDLVLPTGLVIEWDGRKGHADTFSRLRDYRRDNAVGDGGGATMRFGYQDVHENSCECAAAIADRLIQRGWPGFPEKCGPQCRIFQC